MPIYASKSFLTEKILKTESLHIFKQLHPGFIVSKFQIVQTGITTEKHMKIAKTKEWICDPKDFIPVTFAPFCPHNLV